MGVKKITDDVWVDILNRVVLRPRLKPAAGAVAIGVGIRCDAISGISRVAGQAARSIG